MFIEGFGIQGYRSFSDNLDLIGPFERVNLFAGQNNSGKSNILLFIKSHYCNVIQEATRGGARESKFTDLDKPRSSTGVSETKFAFGVRHGGAVHEKMVENRDASIRALVDRVLKSKTLARETGLAWYVYNSANNDLGGAWGLSSELAREIEHEGVLTRYEWQRLWNILTGTSGGDMTADWIPETLRALGAVHASLPPIEFIPAIRRVGAGGAKAEDYSGQGIIERLVPLQNPDHNNQQLKKKFEQINEFLREVTGNRSATIEIPHNRDTILVHMDGKTLPLPSLGTGIHEVIIFAVAGTVLDNVVLCIEEPELHLHPIIQKKLMHYLSSKTSNQYFLTTHSAHLLDTPGAAIFHVTNEDGVTRVRPALTSDGVLDICADLGYRPSDLLQANSIIWCRGPDRPNLSETLASSYRSGTRRKGALLHYVLWRAVVKPPQRLRRRRGGIRFPAANKPEHGNPHGQRRGRRNGRTERNEEENTK
jgi:predicted ATPase